MSGIFLVVQETERKPDASVLRPTRGGYPHITLLYSGDKITVDKLMRAAQDALIHWTKKASGLPTLMLEAKNAEIHSFTEERKSKEDPSVIVKRERHDVLLRLSVDDAAMVGQLRSMFAPDKRLTMHYPHITHSVHYNDKSKAQDVLKSLQDKFPIQVQVVGYTID